MILNTLDWITIVAYFALTLAIGLYYTKLASKNITNFFLGGRNLSWWIAGLSMVATTFAADTPLAVTELVAQSGIAGNWLWWNALSGGMLTTFFFAKYWRRANILTDVELIELRYSGKPAQFLRGFRAIYLGVFINIIIIGWVNVALMSIFKVFFGIENETHLLLLIAASMLVVLLYSSLSGFLGVVLTDAVQFVIAMVGTIILAVLVVNSPKIGGIAQLKAQLPEWSLSFFPLVGEAKATAQQVGTTLTLGLGSFLAFTTMQWWASWYPGAEPGGGGYIAQRMMSTKDEKNAVFAVLFFQIAHYCIRPWPWILVGLCSLVLYPQLPYADKKLGFVMAMRDYLPNGLRGLLLVAFLSAYMSTISTQFNWGASYLVNDFYRRFVRPQASDKQLVFVSRLFTLFIMLLSLIVTTQIKSIAGMWQFLIECGAGLGLVLILRWYWWRINAWSEITATIMPFVGYGFAKYFLGWEFPNSFFLTVGLTTVSWVAITFLTKPTDTETLKKFVQLVNPQGAWRPIRQLLNLKAERASQLWLLGLCWISAIVAAYSILFLIGELIFQEWVRAGVYTFIFSLSLIALGYFSREVKIFED